MAGIILQANHASVSASTAISGATVYGGDSLLTDAGGTLQVRFGGSQAYLMPRSSILVGDASAGLGATLTSGTVIVSSAAGDTFHLLADGAAIRPATSQATVGQITLVNPRELLLTSSRGSLEVTMDNEVKTLPEGSSVRMVIQPPDAAAASSPDPQANGVPPWSPSVTYATGDVVAYNGVLYVSAVSNNLNHAPGAGRTFWSKGKRGGGNNGSGASPTGQNRFLWIALGLVGTGVAIGLILALVSPSKP
jgi:hypothetical protein